MYKTWNFILLSSSLKKKQLRLEAEKLLQEKKFSKPPPEREKTELEIHEEKQNFLFGEKEVNSSEVRVLHFFEIQVV